IDRDQRVAEQVVAGPIAAVIVRAGAAQRHVDRVGVGIGGGVPDPHVGAGPFLPAINQPGFMADFAGLRHGVELPQLGPGARVVSAGVTGRAARHFRSGRTDHHDIAEDGRRVAIRRAYYLDRTTLTERRVDFARRRADLRD